MPRLEDAKKETESKENIAVTEKKISETAAAFEKGTNNVQEMLPEPTENTDVKSKTNKAEVLRSILKRLLDQEKMANKGLLPEDRYQAYLQDLANARAMNHQNGAFEDALLQERADVIQDIGTEYQQNRKVTPELIEKKDELEGIDTILINITKNPKLLFISMILMGLNPFMALGMAVLSAFGQTLVQDLYQKLPESERSNLENRPAQQPEQQPTYNPQIEAYQKALAVTHRKLKEQAMMVERLRQQDKMRLMQQLLMLAQAHKKKEAEKERAKIEEQEKKKETEIKKEKKMEGKQKTEDKKTKGQKRKLVLEKPEKKMERTMTLSK